MHAARAENPELEYALVAMACAALHDGEHMRAVGLLHWYGTYLERYPLTLEELLADNKEGVE